MLPGRVPHVNRLFLALSACPTRCVWPCFPRQVIDVLLARLGHGGGSPPPTTLSPWFKGFRGKVHVPSMGSTCITCGTVELSEAEEDVVRISELPVGRWTDDYKVWGTCEFRPPTPHTPRLPPWAGNPRGAHAHGMMFLV